MTPELRLRELLDRLAAADVRFVIVGGLAVNAWGYVRGTQDAGGRVETDQGRLAPSAIRTFLARATARSSPPISRVQAGGRGLS